MRLAYSFKYTVAFLLIVFSGFFVTQIPTNMPIKFLKIVENDQLGIFGINIYRVSLLPVYFTTLIGVLLLFISEGRNVFKIPKNLYMPVVVAFYYFLTQITKIVSPSAFIIYLMTYLYIYLVIKSLKKIDIEDIKRLSIKFINLSIFLLTCECLWRLLHPVNVPEYILRGSWFYKYKLASFMYMDSNFVAIQAMVMLFFTIYLKKKFFLTLKWQKIILLILIILTFSRAAWIATLLGLLYIHYFHKISASKIFIGVISIVVVSIIIYIKVKADISFGTKFEIINQSIAYFKNSLPITDLLFGIGSGNSSNVLNSISAHNIILIYLIDTGLIGFFLAFGMFFQLWKQIPKVSYLLLPFIIAGLSAYQSACPYLFAALGIMYIVENRDITEIVS